MRKTLKRIIFRKTKFFALRALLNINLLAITNLTLIERMFLAISLYREQNARNIIKKNHLPLYFHFSLYTNIQNIQKNNSFYVLKRYFSSTHNDIHLIEKIEKNINICKKYFLDEHNIIKDISEVYENNSKIYNEFFNIFNRDNIIDLDELSKYLIVVGLPLFGLKEKSLQAIFAVLNEGENKPISEFAIHTILCYNYINNVLAKNINNYLNEIFAKYKYLLVLPEKTDINNINILPNDIIFIFAPSKNLRLLEKKDSILKADIILPCGINLIFGIDLKSEVRLRFDPEDSNSFSFVCEIDSNGKSRIFLFDERISSETPWFLNNQQLASLNFDDSISEEVFKVLTTYMEIFVNELIFLLCALRPYKCFKNKDDGYNYCLYYFKLAKFLKDNKFISNEEFEEFDKFHFEFILNNILNYKYLEKLSPSLATSFCKHLVEEIDLLIKKQDLYNLLLTYIENYPKYKYNIIPVDMLSEKNNNQISSKKIFDRMELLLIEKFNYKQFVNLIIFTKENIRLYKLILILICVRHNFCQYLRIFLLLLFPRNNSSVKSFDVEDIEKVRTDLNNDLIPKIFLHEENLKLFYDFKFLFFGELESLFREYFNININEKTNLTFYHYKKLTGQIHLYLELYQEIVNKVKQKNNFVDDQENIELNQYFKDVCKNFLEIFVNETKNLQDERERLLFWDSSYIELQLNLYCNYAYYKEFLKLIYHYSKVETLEEKEKSFLEIQEFVQSLPKSNIIISLFQIYEL